MADSRRVQLTTLPPGPVPSEPEPAPKPRKSPSAGPRAEVGRPDPGTVRLELALFEADERSSPEFSYSRLVDSKINCTKEKVPLSRFEEEEKRETDEVAAISRKLENLYGDKPKEQQQQQKEDRIQDLIDIGFGYDDEDSFIDNSEAYDEFVPASITTRLGGFYVNSGVLHFRQVSGAEEAEELTTDEETPESPKKQEVTRGHDKPKKKRRTEGAIVREAESR
ncbi:Ubinuclein-1 [Liparis tanakae]|uniref:Ubinuclein-1 n=1 Tax=Liparis tanakae TaxID=230148 RepID=A0A4Z2F8L2_9TELE|nr:Ubinuclein-1 [Liparis tanakae]